MFSQAGIEAAGGREKMRLCSKCGLSLVYVEGQGFCCPRGHGCWLPQDKEQKVLREPLDAVYLGGAIEYKGTKSGKKRKKPPRKQDFSALYNE